MLKQQSLKKSVGALMTGQIFNYLIMLIQIPYLTRHLSPEGFGVYSFVNTLMLVGVYFIGYAVNNSGTFLFRKFVNSPIKRSTVFWNQLSLQCLFAALASVIMLIWIANSQTLQANHTTYLLLILNFFFTALYCPWILSSLEKFKTISMLMTACRIATLILMFVFVNSPDDVALAFGAVIFPNALVALWFIIYILKQGIIVPIAPSRWRPFMVIKRDFPIALSVYATIGFSYIGIILAKFLVDGHDYGLIAFADRFRWIVQAIIPTFGAVLFSRYCGERAQSSMRGALFGGKSALALTGFGLIIALGLAIGAKPAIWLLGGSAFEGSYVPLLIVAASIPLIAINYYMTFFIINVFGLTSRQLFVLCVTSSIMALALVMKENPTPIWVVSVISAGELARAIFTWLNIKTAGHHILKPGVS